MKQIKRRSTHSDNTKIFDYRAPDEIKVVLLIPRSENQVTLMEKKKRYFISLERISL